MGHPTFVAGAGSRGRRDDKGEGRAHLSGRYGGWTEPQIIRDFHLQGWAKGPWLAPVGRTTFCR
jgi:hypothetical protein